MQLTDNLKADNGLPRVTIVTPTYNQSVYLPETIDSVLSQDYPDIEYIVIDDGSTDATREILKRYDKNIRWESQDNAGQAATLNKGWAKATGEIVGYLSSDDLLKPGAVTELVRCLRDNPDIILVYPDYELIDATGAFVRTHETLEYDYSNMIANLVCYPGPGALFRKECFDSAGGWATDLRQVPDMEYWFRLSQYGKFKRLPKVLASSRIHRNSQSFKDVSLECAMEPVTAVMRLIANGGVHLLDPAHANRSLASAYMLSFRLLLRSSYYMASLKSLCKALYLRPALILKGAFWRMVAVAVLGKAYYRIRCST